MKRICWLLAIHLVLLSCNNTQSSNADDVEDSPTATIYLQPYDNFTKEEAEKLKADLNKHLEEILSGVFKVKILSNKALSDSFLGETRKKYRVDKIIDSLKENADEHNIYIGITHHDICREYKNGVKDWGVLGSSIPIYNACVVSDHRLKHKRRDLWKVTTHEFIHTYYKYNHCPKDSTHCIMKDAKGKADFSNKNNLCGYCKNRIKSPI